LQLEQNARLVNISAVGSGFAIAQLSCNYFINETLSNPSYNLSVTFANESCDNKLVIEVCASFLSNLTTETNKLIVLRIELPSGYNFDADTAIPADVQVSKLKCY